MGYVVLPYGAQDGHGIDAQVPGEPAILLQDDRVLQLFRDAFQRAEDAVAVVGGQPDAQGAPVARVDAAREGNAVKQGLARAEGGIEDEESRRRDEPADGPPPAFGGLHLTVTALAAFIDQMAGSYMDTE